MGPAVWETAGQDKGGREGVDYCADLCLDLGLGFGK